MPFLNESKELTTEMVSQDMWNAIEIINNNHPEFK
jgi:hypothetical protein